jgi:hypothetical protein
MTAQELINKINAQYPPRTLPVKYKAADGSVKENMVRFPAEFLENGKAVVWLEGELDSIELKNVII